jgi:hypothetical protein
VLEGLDIVIGQDSGELVAAIEGQEHPTAPSV